MRLDGGRRPGRGGLRAVVQEHGAQGFGHAAVVTAQAGSAPRIRRWGVEDAEVEQHPVGGADHRAVGGPAAAVAAGLGAAAKRRGQLVEVGVVSCVQRPAGLDQQPDDDAFGGAADGVSAVVQVGRRGGERGDVSRPSGPRPAWASSPPILRVR